MRKARKRNIGLFIDRPSKSSVELTKALHSLAKGKKVFRKTSKPFYLINWGSSNFPKKTDYGYLFNINVENAINKIKSFELMGDIAVPYTTDKEVAQNWLDNDNKVVVRSLISAGQGRGIKVVSNNLPDAPLYTLYIPKRKEYRVLVAFGEAFVFMRKFLKDGVEMHQEVRNGKDYNFLNIPFSATKTKQTLSDIATEAVLRLNLDFGAIDILYDLNKKEYRVLEVNTAFGLGERNAKKLAIKILKQIKEIER